MSDKSYELTSGTQHPKTWKARAEKAEAENQKLAADVAALREGLEAALNRIVGHEGYEQNLDLENLLANPNPGERLMAVVEAARQLDRAFTDGNVSAQIRAQTAVRRKPSAPWSEELTKETVFTGCTRWAYQLTGYPEERE